MRPNHKVILLTLLSLPLLTACDKQSDHQQTSKNGHSVAAFMQKTQRTQASVQKKITAPLVKKSPTTVEPTKKAKVQRSPFDAEHIPTTKHNSTKKKDTKHADDAKVLMPKIALSNIRFTGTLTRHDKRWAILASPEGTLYVIKEGQLVSSSKRRVKTITKDSVVIGHLTIHLQEHTHVSN